MDAKKGSALLRAAREKVALAYGYGTIALNAPASPPASRIRPTSPLFILPFSNVLPAGDGGGASGIAFDVDVAGSCEAVATNGCSPRRSRRKTKSGKGGKGQLRLNELDREDYSQPQKKIPELIPSCIAVISPPT